MRARLFVVLFVVLSTAALAKQPPGGGGGGGGRGAPPVILGPPPGVTPLETDLFKSKNFYKDKANWMNKYYYRCNTPQQLSEMWNRRRMGDKPPESASWGDCNT